jgi:dipeptide/tripeptide permease
MTLLYRILICSIPFIASLTGYWLLFPRIRKATNRVSKAFAFGLTAVGVGFTLWQAVVTYSNLTDDSFNVAVLITSVVIMALIAIALAAGEPEK